MADLVIQDALHLHTADDLGSLDIRDFPSNLPCVSRIDGYALEASATVVRTPFDAGNTRQRRMNSGMATKIQLAWRVNNQQLQPLFAWLNQYGYEPFRIELSGLKSSSRNEFKSPVEIRLMSDINISMMRVHRQNWYILTCIAEYAPSITLPSPFDLLRITEDVQQRLLENGQRRRVESIVL